MIIKLIDNVIEFLTLVMYLWVKIAQKVVLFIHLFMKSIENSDYIIDACNYIYEV